MTRPSREERSLLKRREWGSGEAHKKITRKSENAKIIVLHILTSAQERPGTQSKSQGTLIRTQSAAGEPSPTSRFRRWTSQIEKLPCRQGVSPTLASCPNSVVPLFTTSPFAAISPPFVMPVKPMAPLKTLFLPPQKTFRLGLTQ
jgi:hypothetical protein